MLRMRWRPTSPSNRSSSIRDMPAAGQNLGEHITEKYGSTAEQSAASRAMIRSRGAEVGFTFNMSEESRIYNTFDAHRLLHWAGTVGRQRELKHCAVQGELHGWRERVGPWGAGGCGRRGRTRRG